jgi:RNA polymerase sigma factor (sigma-70 family)
MKDQEIIDQILRKDEKALDFLYTKNYRMMTKLIIKNSGTEDEAKDIFQEALIVFWQKIIRKELTLTSKISTYLYSVCWNLWRKELERKKRLSHEEVEGTTIPNHDSQEQIMAIRGVVNSMGETCRKVLSYYYFDGLSMKEVADKLGFANSDTAKTKKYKCKKELDKLVKAKYSANDFLD